MDDPALVEAIRRGSISPEEAAGLAPGEADWGPGDVAARTAASIGHGVLKAGTGMAAFPAFIQDLLRQSPGLNRAFGEIPKDAPSFPHELDIEDYFAKRSKEIYGDYAGVYQPQNQYEKYVSRFSQGAASLPGGRAAIPMLGGVSGVMGEAAHQWDPKQPMARTLGEIMTLLAGAYPAMKTPQIVKAAQEYLATVPMGFRAAQAAREGATERTGVPTILTQGIPTATALSGITEELRSTPMGAKINEILAAQTPAMQDQVSRRIAQTSGLPLEQETAQQVLKAGTEAIEAPQTATTRAAAPLYEAAKKDKLPLFGLQKGSVMDLIIDLLNKKQDLSLRLGGGKPMDDIVKALTKDPTQLPSATEVDRLARIQKGLAEAAQREGASSGQVTGALGSEASSKILTDAAKAASPALSGGKMVYATGQEWLVNPAKKGPLGIVFPDSVINKGIANFDQLAQRLGTLSGPDVADVAARLHAVDPEAFPALVKKYMSDKTASKFETAGGRVPATALNDIPNEFIGTPEKTESFKEMMKGVARAQGRDPDAVANGAVQFMEDMRLMSRDQGNVGISGAGMRQEAGTNIVTQAAKGFGLGMRPFYAAAKWIDAKLYKDTYTKLAEALVSPRGAEMLEGIAKHSMMKQRTSSVARALASVGVQQAGNEYQLPRGNGY